MNNPPPLDPGPLDPFVGFRPFERREADFFFGREKDATRLANMLISSNLSVMYGDSGVGKSSLLNAQLGRALSAIEPDWISIYFNEWQSGCDEKLMRVVSTHIPSNHQIPIEQLAKTLQTLSNERDSPILLILDQFEEFFVYQDPRSSKVITELAKTVNRRSGRVRVLISLRSDGLWLLDSLRIRIPQIYNSMLRLDALTLNAAVNCIRKPISVYNERMGTRIAVPPEDSEIIQALVLGSQQSQILTQLPNHGKGRGTPDSSGQYIIAPFLQLALEELWHESIVVQGRNELSISDLRRLAGLSGTTYLRGEQQSTLQAVGLLVQRHVDEIFNDYNEVEQGICAVAFERMVQPSGQKIAITLASISQYLEVGQEKRAAEILAELSRPTKKMLLKRVALVPTEPEVAFQIVHDAMAIPILNWIERWRRSTRIKAARRATAARAYATMALLILVSSVAGVVYTWMRSQIASTVNQMVGFAAADPQPGFRLPILLSLAALTETNNKFWLIWEDQIRDVLRMRLKQSPQFGGRFSATAFDPENDRVAWLDGSAGAIHICSLNRTDDCRSKNTSSHTTLQLPALGMLSRNELLQKSPMINIGFIRGIDDPVIINKGILHYRDSEKWIPLDIADLINPEAVNTNERDPGTFVFIEVSSGVLKVTNQDWTNAFGTVKVITFNRDAHPPFVLSKSPLSVRWMQQGLVPVYSPAGTFAADLSLAEGSTEVEPCQDLDQAQGFAAAFSGTAALPRKPVQFRTWAVSPRESITTVLCSTPLPRVSAGIGFSRDEDKVAVLFNRKMRVFGSSAGSEPIIDAGFRQTFGAVEPAIGPPFTFGPIAVSKAPLNDRFAFAWQAASGIKLAISGKNPTDLLEPYLQSKFSTLGNKLLYGEPASRQSPLVASRLEFSDDMRFLILQGMDFPTRTWALMVWRLDQHWSDLVDRMVDGNRDALIKFACTVAKSDLSSHGPVPSFTNVEEIQWRAQGRSPCQSLQ